VLAGRFTGQLMKRIVTDAHGAYNQWIGSIDSNVSSQRPLEGSSIDRHQYIGSLLLMSKSIGKLLGNSLGKLLRLQLRLLLG
jgi:hypothetical protein